MKKRMKNAELKDYIKACRKAGREEEIAAHGRPVAVFRIHKSKKAYDRKRMKAADKKSLPFFVPKSFKCPDDRFGFIGVGKFGHSLD